MDLGSRDDDVRCMPSVLQRVQPIPLLSACHRHALTTLTLQEQVMDRVLFKKTFNPSS